MLARAGLLGSSKNGGAPAPGDETKASSSSPKKRFSLPSDLKKKKGVVNPLDLKVPQLPKLYNEPVNSLNQYSRVDDAAHVRPSDRIARNYTASSKMLTVAEIEKATNPSIAVVSGNPFSRADLQSINVPVEPDPLHIPVNKGRGHATLVPSPKRSNRQDYNADKWQPALHGTIRNGGGEAKEDSSASGNGGNGTSNGALSIDVQNTILNFHDAVDREEVSQVMPIKQQWVRHCLAKVRKYQHAPGAEEILLSCLGEVQDAYQYAIKTAIVNYKILSPRGASRAGVSKEVLDNLESWQQEEQRWNMHLTPEWRILRQTGIDESSILASKEKIWQIFNTLGSAMGRLQQLWLSRVAGTRLCDNRFTNFDEKEFSDSLPLPVRIVVTTSNCLACCLASPSLRHSIDPFLVVALRCLYLMIALSDARV